MQQVEEKLESCPKCETDLMPYHLVGSVPSFCLQCKFPLMKVADKYRLLKIVGQGAVGTVYLARHVKLRHNADRVVKVIKEEMLNTSTTVQRFFREVQVTAELSENNEHIVRIYDDFGELPHLGYFYVMEFIRGVSMRQHIQQQTYLPTLEWCVDVMGQLSDALHTAHMAGVIHRDLKPDNMMITEKGAHKSFLKVLDWGIAKPLVEDIDVNLTQGLVGTPHYMAPEQAMNQDIDARTDIYAMAVIFYEILTGINPFVAATGKKGRSHDSMIDLINAQLYQDPPPIHEILPQRQDVSADLENVIFKALEKNPNSRFNNVLEFWDAIQEATGMSNTTPVSHITAHASIAPLSMNPNSTPVPTGQFTGQMSVEQPGQVNTGEPSQVLASVARQGLSLAHQDSWQETVVHHPDEETKQRWGVVFGIALAVVLILGVGTWGWMQSRSQKSSTIYPSTQRARMVVPVKRTVVTVRRKVPLPRRVATLVLPTNDAGNAGNTGDDDDDNQVEPKARPRSVRIVPQRRRRVRRRRIKRRRVRRRPPPRAVERRPVAARPTSPCPAGWKPMRIQPFLSRSAEVTAEGGRWKRISSRLVCISPKTRRVSIVQEGYDLCIFRVSKRSSLRVKLFSAGSGGISAANCLRR